MHTIGSGGVALPPLKGLEASMAGAVRKAILRRRAFEQFYCWKLASAPSLEPTKAHLVIWPRGPSGQTNYLPECVAEHTTSCQSFRVHSRRHGRLAPALGGPVLGPSGPDELPIIGVLIGSIRPALKQLQPSSLWRYRVILKYAPCYQAQRICVRIHVRAKRHGCSTFRYMTHGQLAPLVCGHSVSVAGVQLFDPSSLLSRHAKTIGIWTYCTHLEVTNLYLVFAQLSPVLVDCWDLFLHLFTPSYPKA